MPEASFPSNWGGPHLTHRSLAILYRPWLQMPASLFSVESPSLTYPRPQTQGYRKVEKVWVPAQEA